MAKNFGISAFPNIPDDAGEHGALDPIILLEKGISCPKCFRPSLGALQLRFLLEPSQAVFLATAPTLKHLGASEIALTEAD